ncbi:hypothetical protein B0H10DRAFT_1181519 [Mycena sp. CBHHK59/15]|nr:hypothetical protein B0H10DRAFT_1181519 [Mycena sp. CBHHK59/15]
MFDPPATRTSTRTTSSPSPQSRCPTASSPTYNKAQVRALFCCKRLSPTPCQSSPSPPTPPVFPCPSSKRRRSPYDRPASSPPIAMPTHSGSPSPSASSLDRSPLSARPSPVLASAATPRPRRRTTRNMTCPAAMASPATCTRPRLRTRTMTTATRSTRTTPRPCLSPSSNRATCPPHSPKPSSAPHGAPPYRTAASSSRAAVSSRSCTLTTRRPSSASFISVLSSLRGIPFYRAFAAFRSTEPLWDSVLESEPSHTLPRTYIRG